MTQDTDRDNLCGRFMISLKCPARQHKTGNATHVAGPPDRRPHDTQPLRLNEDIRRTVGETGDSVPQTDAVDARDCYAGI